MPKIAEFDFENIFDTPYEGLPQATINALPAPAQHELDTLWSKWLTNEGKRDAHQKLKEKTSAAKRELMNTIGHLDNALAHGAARSNKTDADRAGWFEEIKRLDDRLLKSAATTERLIDPPLEVLNFLQASPGVNWIDARLFPEIPEGSTAAEMVVEKYAEIDRENAARKIIADQPLPLDYLIKSACADIDRRAAMGAPRQSLKVDHSKGRPTAKPVTWPLDVLVGTMVADTRINMEAFSFWLHADQIKTRVAADITASYPANVLSKAERETALAESDAKIMVLHREAEAFFKMAERDNARVIRKRGAPPEAILGIARA